MLLLVKYLPFSYKKLVVYKYLKLFSEITCLLLILAWCDLFDVVMCVTYLCLHTYIVIIYRR
jgi:hypothetical protein